MDHPHYETAEGGSELLTRTISPVVVRNQAEFLGLALSLKVPIFSYTNSIYHSALSLSTGSGVSSMVHQSLRSFQPDISNDFANGTNNPWFGNRRGRLPIARMVRKRIKVDARDQQDEASILAACVNELRILSLVSVRENGNIVKLIGLGWEEQPNDGRFWPELFLDFGQQGTLSDWLAREDPEAQKVLDVARQILLGLQSLHENQIVHCDLKPANILISHETITEVDPESLVCVAKLADFGFSIILSDHANEAVLCQKIGTEPWSSPELTFRSPVNASQLPKSDSFSFGLVLTYLLTNRRLYPEPLPLEWAVGCEDADKDSLVWNVASKRVIDDADIPSEWRQILLKILPLSLDYNPEKRLGSEALLNNFMALSAVSATLDLHSLQQDHPTFDLTTVSDELGDIDECEENEDHCGSESESGLDTITSSPVRRQLIPDFMDERSFRPHALPPCALREVLNSIKSIAASHSPDLEEATQQIAAEASLQLAIANINGLSAGVATEDSTETAISTGVDHLAISVQRGSSKAKVVARQIFDGLQRTMADDVRQYLGRDFPELAKHQILEFYFKMLIKDRIRGPPIAAVIWMRDDPEAYRDYFNSDEFREGRGVGGFGFLISENLEQVENWDDGDVELESYNIKKMDLFDMDRSPVFVREVESKDCTNRSLRGQFTLLQHAIVRSDLDLVQLILDELQADIEAYGNTPGWTPLWLSVAMGHFEISKMLIDRGANMHCSDSNEGFTILHLLGRFWDPAHAIEIGGKALQAGLSASTVSKHGLSTLHMAMKGWFEVRPPIVDLLLRHGANPLVQSSVSATALDYAIYGYDFESLAMMTDSSSAHNFSTQSLAEAKFQAFQQLLVETKFGLLSQCGSNLEACIAKAVAALVDDDMESTMASHDWSRGSSALSAACFNGRSHMLKHLIERAPQDIDKLTGTDKKQPSLHWAIEMKSRPCIDILLDHGASITALNEAQKNAFHVAAQHYPSLIDHLIERLRCPESRLDDEDLKNALEQQDAGRSSVFSILVFEGSGRRLRMAKRLRRQYRLEHDLLPPGVAEEYLTILGGLIISAGFKGPVQMAQIRFMLNIEPSPRFLCSNHGGTLLMLAVTGLRSYSEFEDRIADTTLRLVLERYVLSESDINTVNHSGNYKDWSVVHYAAWYPNPFALDLLHDFCQERGWSLHYNGTVPMENSPVTTPLDLAISRIVKPTLLEEETSKLDHRALSIRSEKAAECYVKLRSRGAVRGDEIRGLVVLLIGRDGTDVTEFQIRKTVNEMGAQFGLDCRYLGDQTMLLAPSTSTHPGEPLTQTFIFELVWVYDRFWIQGYEFHQPNWSGRPGPLRSEERRKIVARYAWDNCPWGTKTYTENLYGDAMVQWSRTGAEWQDEDVEALMRQVHKAAKEKLPLTPGSVYAIRR